MTLLLLFLLMFEDFLNITYGIGNNLTVKWRCDKFSHYVYIKLDRINLIHCGGSLLSKDYVLTAAHCCQDQISAILYTGYNKTSNKWEQKREASRFILHRFFNNETFKNDICIIEVQKAFELTNYTKVVNVIDVNKSARIIEGDDQGSVTKLKIFGFGFLDVRDKSNGELKCINVSLSSQKLCRYTLLSLNDSWDNRFDKNISFCTIRNKDINLLPYWIGNSGGPIMLNNDQIGIISWGVQSPNIGLIFYARLDHSMDMLIKYRGSSSFINFPLLLFIFCTVKSVKLLR